VPPPQRSIVRLTYATEEPRHEYATGFFVDTREFGKVCVTAQHFFRPGFYHGPKGEPKKALVNGKLAELIFDAYEEYGIDVALVTIPPDLPAEEIYFHTVGISRKSNSAFYAHAWSGSREEPTGLHFTKIWGVRVKLQPAIDGAAKARKEMPVVWWSLQSHVAKLPEPFDTQFFQSGWSGAPVFNVRSEVDAPRVVGVLSKHVGERDAKAVSVESLEFLEPREPKLDDTEVMPPALNPQYQQAIEQVSSDRLSRREIALLKFQEIAGVPPVPKIAAPPSPYDDEDALTSP
jgi:hypothetical protein